MGEPEPEPEPELGSTTEELRSIDAEVQAAFDDAACFCEAQLVHPAEVASQIEALPEETPIGEWVRNQDSAACTGDPRLAAYARTHSLEERRTGACLSGNSPHGGTVAQQRPPADDEFVRNGCVRAVGSTDAGAHPAAGFCQADFNYCVAQQLRLKAESFVVAPGSEVRAAVLREARVRHQMAAEEMAETLVSVDQNAGGRCELGDYTAEVQQAGPEVSTFDYSAEKCSCGSFGCFCYLDRYGAEETCRQHGGAVIARHRRARPADVDEDEWNDLIEILSTHTAFDYVGREATCTVRANHPVAVTDQHCVTDDDVREQQRVRGTGFSTAYGDVALMRITDALSQAEELTEMETRVWMATSDAVAQSPAYAEDVWGQDGARLAALESIVGDRTPVAGDAPAVPWSTANDHGPQLVLGLLSQHGVELPYEICIGETTGTIVSQRWLADGTRPTTDPVLAAWLPTAKTALENAVAAQLGRPGEGAVILRDELGIRDADILGGALLARDVTTVLSSDHTWELGTVTSEPADPCEGNLWDPGCNEAPTELSFGSFGGGGNRNRGGNRGSFDSQLVTGIFLPPPATCHRAILKLNAPMVAQRLPQQTMAAYRDGSSSFPGCRLDGDDRRARHFHLAGAAGGTNWVRQRLHTLASQGRLRDWGRDPVLDDALFVADAAVGDTWTETEGATWRMFGEVADLIGEEVLMLRGEEQLGCAVNGHAPGRPVEQDCTLPTPVVLGATSRDGVTGVTATIPERETYAHREKLFVVLPDCTANGCGNQVLDVVYPRSESTEHAFAGSLGQRAALLLAKQPTKPSRPLYNSLLVLNDEIPSLNNELDADGNFLRERWVALLDSANAAAFEAVEALSIARSVEDRYLQDAATAVAAEDLAELDHAARINDTCGEGRSAADCAVPRRAEVTLGELGLVPSPGMDPGAFPYATCGEFFQNASFELPEDGTKDYIEEFVGGSLECTHWSVLLMANVIPFRDVPEAVIDALERGEADFSAWGGAVREELEKTYGALRDIQQAVRRFESAYQIAQLNLAESLSLIDALTPSGWSLWTCKIGRTLMAVGAIVAVVAPMIIVAAKGGAAAAVVAAFTTKAGAAALGAGMVTLGKGIEGLGSISKCDGDGGDQRAALSAYASALASMEEMRTLTDRVMGLTTVVAVSGNRLDTLEASARLSERRVAIERRLASSASSLQPTSRALQSYRVQEARRMLTRAQKRFVTARRALEFRTVTDLSASPVSAPWADDIFTVSDAVFESGGVATPVAAGELDRYRQDLNDFIVDYPDYFGFTPGTGRAVLSLREMLGIDPFEPIVPRLAFKCRNHPDLLPGGLRPEDDPFFEPCSEFLDLGGVDYVTVPFAIPNGISGYYAGRIQPGQANYRMDSVAMNIESNGAFFDCFSGDFPSDCERNKTVFYELQHGGLLGMQSLDGDVHMLDMPRARLAADAPATEMIIAHPPNESEPIFSSFARDAWRGRPLSGQYDLTLLSRDEMIWSSLQDVQVVVKYRFWTAD